MHTLDPVTKNTISDYHWSMDDVYNVKIITMVPESNGFSYLSDIINTFLKPVLTWKKILTKPVCKNSQTLSLLAFAYTIKHRFVYTFCVKGNSTTLMEIGGVFVFLEFSLCKRAGVIIAGIHIDAYLPNAIPWPRHCFITYCITWKYCQNTQGVPV